MMIMTTWQGVITIIMAMLGTMLTRFLPFLLFRESLWTNNVLEVD